MNKEEIKKIVVDYINKNESASYAELQWLFEKKGYDYKGKLLSCSDVCEHVVFWSGWNAEAFDLGPPLPCQRYSARCSIRRTIGRRWCL